MKISYSSNIEESLESKIRLAELSGTYKKSKIFAAIFPSIIFIIIVAMIDGDIRSKLLFMAFGLSIYISLLLLRYKSYFRNQNKRELHKSLKGLRLIPGEIEICDKHISHKSMGEKMSFDWENAIKSEITDEFIEIYFKYNAYFVIPKRIFHNNEEQKEWLNYIKNKI